MEPHRDLAQQSPVAVTVSAPAEAAAPSLKPAISTSTSWLYGLGAVAYGVKDNGFAYFLLFFYRDVVGLSGQLAGVAIFIALLLDAVSDPIVGAWSDRTRSRWGRRHPFMYASALPVSLVYLALWYPPAGLSQGGLFVYLTATAVAIRFFITLYETPSTSIVAELTEHYDERTRLLGLRYLFGWLGGLAMAFLMWRVFAGTYGLNNARAYEIFGAVGSVAIFAAIMASSIGLHSQIPRLRQPPERGPGGVMQLVSQIGTTLHNKNFLALFVAGSFAGTAAGVSTTLNVYLNTFFWGFTPIQVSTIVLSLALSAVLATFLASSVTRRWEKKRSAIWVYGISLIYGSLPILLRLAGWFPANDNPWLFPIIVVHQVSEVTLIILFGILQSSMLADIVEHSQLSTARREEGLFFAARTFIQKVTTGVGTLVAGVALTLIHFPTSATAADVSDAAVFRLGLIYGPSLMVLYALALTSLSFYGITRSGHEGNLAALRGR